MRCRIFFSSKMDGHHKREITNILNMNSTSDLGRYLGVPIIHGRVSAALFREVIDRVQTRLTNWKAKYLSLAGRATLIQSVTSALPTYIMQTNWLPQSTCNNLDKLNRSFLWAADGNPKKAHLVGWNTVTKCKKDGGIGIKVARNMNIALLAKWGWQCLLNSPAAWCTVFKNKYLKQENILEYTVKASDSRQWKGIVKSFQTLTSKVRWRIGNGRSVSFWDDTWVGSSPLNEMVEGEIEPHEKHLKVSDVLSANGDWNLDMISTPLPQHIVDLIWSIPITRSGEVEDVRIWNGAPNGQFTVKSAYLELNRYATEIENQWNWLWKITCPHRFKFFLWLAQHDRLMTNSLRYTRAFAATNICSRCNSAPEDSFHALIGCPKSMMVWEFILTPTDFYSFLSIGSSSWIKENIKREFGNIVVPTAKWKSVFIATAWTVWKARNKEIFDHVSPNIHELVHTIKGLVLDLEIAFPAKQVGLVGTKITSGWSKPDPGWNKINTDGSYVSRSGLATMGGLIRNEDGVWIRGFSCKLGCCSITNAEILAIREGLRLAWEIRLRRVELESDSEVALAAIRNADTSLHPLGNVIEECRRYFRLPWDFRWRHIPREGNAAADCLAKMAHNRQLREEWWDDPPDGVLDIVTAEAL